MTLRSTLKCIFFFFFFLYLDNVIFMMWSMRHNLCHRVGFNDLLPFLCSFTMLFQFSVCCVNPTSESMTTLNFPGSISPKLLMSIVLHSWPLIHKITLTRTSYSRPRQVERSPFTFAVSFYGPLYSFNYPRRRRESIVFGSVYYLQNRRFFKYIGSSILLLGRRNRWPLLSVILSVWMFVWMFVRLSSA